MIKTVSLFYFKNHKETTINFDSLFNVIVGRNGSGKSAVLDAIEWCLFHSKGSDLRASSYSDLVNIHKPKDAVMAVHVSLSNQRE